MRALCEAGPKVGTPSRKDFPARVRDLTAGDAILTGLTESLLSVINIMTDEAAKVTKRALEVHVSALDDRAWRGHVTSARILG